MGAVATLAGITAASDLTSGLLTFYVKEGFLAQTLQERPLLKILEANKKSFPGGKDYISSPVYGTLMSDSTDFHQGYAEGEELVFSSAASMERAYVSWYEISAGLVITWTELKQDGISVVADNTISQHANAEAVRICSGVFKQRVQNFIESWAIAQNEMFWSDGTASQKVPGLRALLTDTPNVGTTAGIDRASKTWWRHRARLGALASTANTGPAIQPSKTDQTLTKTLRKELRQLMRYGGRPSVALCGSDFLDAIAEEVHEKGVYTMEGFVNNGKNDIGMTDVSMKGLGTFRYDPTLDTLGLSKRCYVIDPKKLNLRPMEGEENKVLDPNRPYNYAVIFKNMMWTGGLEVTQMNAHGVYEVA